jgi:hypothetical protein
MIIVFWLELQGRESYAKFQRTYQAKDLTTTSHSYPARSFSQKDLTVSISFIYVHMKLYLLKW